MRPAGVSGGRNPDDVELHPGQGVLARGVPAGGGGL